MKRGELRHGVRPRVVGGRQTRPTFLIVCEGAKTEPQYFNGFKLTSAKVIPTGRNTKSLVEEAIRLKTIHLAIDGEARNHYWCVFDRDSFPAEHFNAAIQKAQSNGFHVAYSNEAFEVWYLLHFEYFTAGLDRRLYREKLTQRLNRTYEKNDPTIFESLRQRQTQAIKHARKLLASYPTHRPERDNPCTTVHLLVEQLRAARGEPTELTGDSQR